VKIFILFPLLLTSLYSDAQFYIGSAIGYYNELFKANTSIESSSYLANFKVGYGERKAYAIELSYNYLDNQSKIFSANDGAKNELDINLIKSFDFGTYIIPFIKAGFGSGYMDIDRKLQSSLHYGSFNLGTGLFIPINKHFDLEIAYEYKYISYEAIELINEKTNYNSNSNSTYFGFNVRF
jgi:opacity protein-like surface antigen